MQPQDAIFHQAEDAKRSEKRKARRQKLEKMEKGFWRSFLLTEDGKPKSGLLIYTFCLSFVFLGIYIAAFWLVIEELTQPLSALPPVLGNLIQSVLVGIAASALSTVMHMLLPDKRLAFGTHLWLAVYVVACVITLAIMLGDWSLIGTMLVFALWFAVIPVAMGLGVTYLLFRRDYVPPRQVEEKPEWTKYTQRW
ncbi:MAG: hypothetical protein ACI4P4_03015 [Faecousia sp.]